MDNATTLVKREVSEGDPLLILICQDSNIPGSKGMTFGRGAFVLTRQRDEEQQQWLEAELAKPRTTSFLAVAAHHSLYSNGQHRDNTKLIAQWGSLLRRYKIDL
jgi:3',5'-cyclic AMP phosphodiesterase CpdA